MLKVLYTDFLIEDEGPNVQVVWINLDVLPFLANTSWQTGSRMYGTRCRF